MAIKVKDSAVTIYINTLEDDIPTTEIYTLNIPTPLIEATLLSSKKAADYNGGVERSAYFPLGLPSYAQEIYKKGLRLVSLAKIGKPPKNESVRDTALDIINYANFLIEAIDKGELDK